MVQTENMVKITKMQYWQLENAINHNNHLNISGHLEYIRDNKGERRYNFKNDGSMSNIDYWLVSDKTGYYSKPELLSLIKGLSGSI